MTAAPIRRPVLPTIPRVGPREALRMAHAALLMGVSEVLLRCTSVDRAVTLMGFDLGLDEATRLYPSEAPWFRLSPDERRSIRAVRRLSRHLYGVDRGCLRRCLALGRLLRRRAVVMRIGVVRIDGELRSHAWLEVDGVRLEPDEGYVAMAAAGR